VALGQSFSLAVVLSGINRLTGPLNRGKGDLAKFGKAATRVGTALTLGVTVPLIGMGAGAIRAAAGFEHGMNKVRAITGETKEAIKPLSDEARRLGKLTQFSATEAADGLARLSQQGFSLEEQFQSLEPVLNLAAGADIGIAESAAIAAGALRGMRKPASDMAGMADVMAKAIASSGTNLLELGEALTDAAPAAAQSGIAFTETVAVLGKMADNMFLGTRAGNAFKRGIVELTKFAPRTEQAFARLGIKRSQILDSQGNVRSLIGTLELLQKAGAGTRDFIDIFGARAFVPFAAAAGKSTEELRKLEAKLSENGFAAKQAGILMSGTTGALARLRASVEDLGIRIGETGLLDRFRELVDWLAKTIDKFGTLSKSTQRFSLMGAGVMIVLGPLLLAFGALVPLFTVLGAKIVAVGLLLGPVIALGVSLWRTFRDVFKAVRRGFALTVSDIKSGLGSLARMILPDWLLNLLGGSGGGVRAAVSGSPGGRPSLPVTAERMARAAAHDARVRVELPNVPRGSRVTTENSGVDFELDLGFAMQAPS